MTVKSVKKVLIVEDDLALSYILEKSLKREGFSVFLAKDGAEGLKMFSASKPDLVLLDIIMPKMDGFTMLKELRKTKSGKATPVIILTNLADPQMENKMTDQKVIDYLVKSDWTIADLMKRIRKVFRGK